MEPVDAEGLEVEAADVADRRPGAERAPGLLDDLPVGSVLAGEL